MPDGNEVEVFRNAIEALPDQDNPELFGLHSNADLTFRRLQVGGGRGWGEGAGRGLCTGCAVAIATAAHL